jgi:arylsulfatase A
MTYEGGQRVPFIARFPGRIPKGKVCAGVGSIMDMMPTIAGLCGAALPSNPLDGADIWPMLTAAKPELDREVLLYFDNVNLQCARLGKWKLHLARYNSAAYSPAPAGGRVNLPLRAPELYDVTTDVAESYDAAPENPKVVADIVARVERVMAGMPGPILEAWRETRARTVNQHPTGQLPAIAKPPQ